MDGPSFLFLYAVGLLALLFASWIVRLLAGDLFIVRLLFAFVFVGIGLNRYFNDSTDEMHDWSIMWVGMAVGTILFFVKVDEISAGNSSGGGCGGGGIGGGGDSGGCGGGGGCGGCG